MTTLIGSSVGLSVTMGPPAAGLEQGQFGIGADYTYSHLSLEMDEGTSSIGPVSRFIADPVRTDVLAARAGYGVRDYLEVTGLLGGVRGRTGDSDDRFSGDGLAYGFGAKATLRKQERLTWGGLFQMAWYDIDGKWRGVGWSGDADIEFWQIQVAAGPTYRLCDHASIYGGPFWQCIDGEKTYKEPGYHERYDVDPTSNFGGYFGARINPFARTGLDVEFQFTEDDTAIGVNLIRQL